jgi:peroxiredoxin
MPDMQQIYEERGADDVVVLAVNLQEAPEPVKTFVGKYGLRFPILMDMTGEISQAYRVSTLPTSFFIDKDGNMSSFNIGALNRTAMLKRIDRSVEPQP